MPGGCSIESIGLFKGGPTYSMELYEWITGEQYYLYNYNPRSQTFERKARRDRNGDWVWEKKYKKKGRR